MLENKKRAVVVLKTTTYVNPVILGKNKLK